MRLNLWLNSSMILRMLFGIEFGGGWEKIDMAPLERGFLWKKGVLEERKGKFGDGLGALIWGGGGL